jgi:transposase
MGIPMTSSQQRKPCLSDLSDARWALMESTLTAWRAERQKTSLNLGGKVTDLREVMNAILFLNRTGVPWRYLPHDFPPHTTVFSYFSAWTADGTIEKLGIHLRRMVHEQEGRTTEPTACVIDAQSVKTAPACPPIPRASTPARRSQDANAASSSSTPSDCYCWSW